MITENAFKTAGLTKIEVNPTYHMRGWRYRHDDTDLIVSNELGSAMFRIVDGRPEVTREYYRGSILDTASLVAKLIKYGRNVSGAPDKGKEC